MEVCPVCDTTENLEKPASCIHKVCSNCITEIRKRNAKCPVCREPFRSAVDRKMETHPHEKLWLGSCRPGVRILTEEVIQAACNMIVRRAVEEDVELKESPRAWKFILKFWLWFGRINQNMDYENFVRIPTEFDYAILRNALGIGYGQEDYLFIDATRGECDIYYMAHLILNRLNKAN